MLNKPQENPELARRRAIIAASIGGAVFVLALGIGWYVYVVRANGSTPVAAEPTATPTDASPSAQVTDVTSPSPSPTATPTPTASPTATSVALPDTVRAQVVNFYTAYKQQDRDRLGSMFTADTDDGLKLQHSLLFTGADLSGFPGGPTLFSSGAVSERATDYTIVSWAKAGEGWDVTVSEMRIAADDTKLPAETTVLTFVSAPAGTSTWLISTYVHAGSSGKYNGFFTQ